MFTRIVSILLLCSLIGCGSSSRAPYSQAQSAVRVYVVERGDTLYSIAFRYGLDYRKVAQVNSIPDPYTIYPGQNIYLWQVTPSPAGAAPTPDLPGPVAAPPPNQAAPAAPGTSTSSPVVVTAVPGIAAAPISQVATPPRPVYQAPPVTSGVYHPGSAPVQAPAIETPPINGQAPANATPAPAVSPASASAPPQPQVPGQVGPGTAPEPTLAAGPAPAPPPAVSPAPARAPTPGGKVTTWRWPASGSITRGYSPSVHKGIDIDGKRGDPIHAVADGTVVYAGTGIVGFGELVIIKHNEIYISAYGHNDRLLVKENDVVGVGQVIAEKGSSGTDTVKLHFEIRKEGKPIDPLKLLPGR